MELLSDVKHSVTSELSGIHQALTREAAVHNDYSLMQGLAGVNLFLAQHYQYQPVKNDADLAVIHDLCNRIAEQCGSVDDLSFARGLSGMLWSLSYVNRLFDHSLLDTGSFDDIDADLYASLQDKMDNGNFDLLFGSLGDYIYLRERNAIRNPEDFAALYHKVIKASTYGVNKKYFWLDYMNVKLGKGYAYNLGLAHGIPSMWYLLTDIAGFLPAAAQQEIAGIICDSYEAMKTFSINGDDLQFSKFPTEIRLDDQLQERTDYNRRSTRLSWCYGDLAIASTLLHAGKQLQHKGLYAEGLALADRTLKRDTRGSAVIYDNCLCHGGSSCILIYNAIYRTTGLQRFRDASIYWYEQGLDFKRGDGYFFYEDKDVPLAEKSSLLEGLTGIGLSYQSLVQPATSDWQKILLL
ncbi:lanthionine synthetase LanC family protein [Taibaiella chishuiensis]|uniref:Lanthionine synthetase-like protein n=1 Tax=Taibaiella chishuiensis TaxID=1434707 RepID=A0A2P8DBW0_9BACT|nr:lanthionine synthetase LanC family protein [Taibaiella chishuiensis]PSK94710.1 lanthionine synthetase-like protein [Taibaiella chishuiensis]